MAVKDYDKILTRLVMILSKLSANERPNTAELALEFNVSIRTIQQDVYKRLLSFPIIKNKQGRLCFIDGYSLDRSMFDTNEMILISLGLSQFNGVKKLSSINNSLNKKILNSNFHNPYFIKQDDIEEIDIDSRLNNSIEDAIKDRYIIEIKCIENGIFEVEPYKIANFDGIWYLFAKDVNANKIKTYILSNIKSIKVLTKKHKKNIKVILAQLEELNTAWFEDGQSFNVKVKISNKISKYFVKKDYFENQTIEEKSSNGELIISFSVSSYSEFDNIVKSWLPDIEVIEPKEYRDKLKKELQEYIER